MQVHGGYMKKFHRIFDVIFSLFLFFVSLFSLIYIVPKISFFPIHGIVKIGMMIYIMGLFAYSFYKVVDMGWKAAMRNIRKSQSNPQ